MTAKTYKLTEGLLTLGEPGSPLVQDIAAQVTSGQIEANVDAEDDVPLLDGDTESGDETYTWELSGNLFQDITESGIVRWSWNNKGAQVPFTFVPNASMDGAAEITGQIKVRPITVGGDVKAKQRSDFAFPLVGDPVIGDYTGPGAQGVQAGSFDQPEG